MVFGVDDALIIIGILATIASTSATAGSTASQRRKQAIADKAEAEKTAEQKRQVDRQKDRRRNLGTLGRQAEKRVAATGASREKSAIKPTRGALDPQQAPQRAMAPKPGMIPQAPVSAGGAAGMVGKPVGAPATQDVGANIVKGVEIAATVGQGIAAGASAAQQQRADDSKAQEIEELRNEEFEKAMSNLRKDVNLEAMDFRQASSALPTRNALSFNQDMANTLRKFSGRRAA